MFWLTLCLMLRTLKVFHGIFMCLIQCNALCSCVAHTVYVMVDWLDCALCTGYELLRVHSSANDKAK